MLLDKGYFDINQIFYNLNLLDILFRRVHLVFEHVLPSIGLGLYDHLILDLEEPKLSLPHHFHHC